MMMLMTTIMLTMMLTVMMTTSNLSSDMLEEREDVEISSSNYLLQHRMDHDVAAGPGDDDDDNDDDDDGVDDGDDDNDDDADDDKNLPTPALQWTTTGESGEGFAAAEFLEMICSRILLTS